MITAEPRVTNLRPKWWWGGNVRIIEKWMSFQDGGPAVGLGTSHFPTWRDGHYMSIWMKTTFISFLFISLMWQESQRRHFEKFYSRTFRSTIEVRKASFSPSRNITFNQMTRFTSYMFLGCIQTFDLIAIFFLWHFQCLDLMSTYSVSKHLVSNFLFIISLTLKIQGDKRQISYSPSNFDNML